MLSMMYRMGLNPSQFVGGLAAANSALTRTKGFVGGLTGAVGKLTGAMAALGAGAAAFGGLKKALTLGADFEKTEVGMNTIIKNLQVTRGLIGQLQNLAANTPLELPDLTGGARAMLGAGWNLGDIVADIKTFGDVAAGAQTDVGGLIQIIAQVKGKGRLMAEEMLQFSERGVAGLRDALADVEGVDASQIAKVMERGEISADDLINAFRRMTSQSGIFFNAMQNDARTNYGLLSTLRDTVNKIFLAFGRPLNDALKPLLQSAIGLAERVAGKATEIVGAWQVAFANGQLGNVLMGQLNIAITGGVKALTAAFSGGGNVFAGLQSSMGWLFNPNLWKGIANYVDLGLQAAGHGFVALLIQGTREMISGLPQLLKAQFNDDVMENKQHAASSRAATFGAAMMKQGMMVSDKVSQGISTSKQAAQDAATVARVKHNNALNEQKNAYNEAAKPSGGGGVSGWMGAAAGAMKQAMNYASGAGASAPATDGGGGGGDASGGGGEGTPATSSGNRRGKIKGYSFKKQFKPRGSALDYLKGSGLSNPITGPSPLDYLKGKGLSGGYQPRTQTTRERTESARQQNEANLLQVLQEIANNTAGIKVV